MVVVAQRALLPRSRLYHDWRARCPRPCLYRGWRACEWWWWHDELYVRVLTFAMVGELVVHIHTSTVSGEHVNGSGGATSSVSASTPLPCLASSSSTSMPPEKMASSPASIGNVEALGHVAWHGQQYPWHRSQVVRRNAAMETLCTKSGI